MAELALTLKHAVCRCGHRNLWHEHYSSSTHCSKPGCSCPQWRRQWKPGQ